MLGGLLPETPLGKIVQIRSEDDPEVLKGFTMSQHGERNRWRVRRQKALYGMPEKEQSYNIIKSFMSAFKK